MKYPQTLVPGVPRYQQRKELTAQQLAKRCVYYERFLVAVLKSMTLRSCPFMVDFLRENVPRNFELSAEAHLKDPSIPHKLEDLNTLTGEIDCEVSEEARKFCDGLPIMNDTYHNISVE